MILAIKREARETQLQRLKVQEEAKRLAKKGNRKYREV